MNMQEAFDTMVTHMVTQGRQAIDDSSCRYRLGELKCAVGALIPDDDYQPDWDTSPNDVRGIWPDIRHLFDCEVECNAWGAPGPHGCKKKPEHVGQCQCACGRQRPIDEHSERPSDLTLTDAPNPQEPNAHRQGGAGS